MKILSLSLLAAAMALAGCAQPAPRSAMAPSATLSQIKDEMRAAHRDAPAPVARPDAVDRALLPPLQA